MVRDVIAAKVLPDGALSLLCGGIGDLLDHVGPTTSIAFTGSSETANRIRAHPQRAGARHAGECGGRQRERRAAGARRRAGDACLRCLHQGSRARDDGEGRAEMHRHPPRAGAGRARRRGGRGAGRAARQDDGRRSAQREHAHGAAGHARAAGGGPGRHRPACERGDSSSAAASSAQARRHRSGEIGLRRADVAQARQPPTRRAPCTTPKCSVRWRPSSPTRTSRKPSRSRRAAAARWSSRFLATIAEFLARAVARTWARSHGRVLAVDPSIADAHTGHGIVMPQCHHGGPGRAGNGTELGGLYGLRFYHQRVAVQGSTDLLAALQAKAAALH